MCRIHLLCFVIISNKLCCESSEIFHENTKVTFSADDTADYFGFSVLLNHTELFVGAPKARSRTNTTISPGLVFSCPINYLEAKNVTCRPIKINDEEIYSLNNYGNGHSYKIMQDDMWFGAVIALVPIGALLICAPRWTINNSPSGGCYFLNKSGEGQWISPAQEVTLAHAHYDDMLRQDFAQAGFSAKVTNEDTLIIGIPGFLWWAGGISEYKLYENYGRRSVSLKMSSIIIEHDDDEDINFNDYLGYSVESGKFYSNGKILYVAGAPRSKRGYGQVLIFDQTLFNIKAKVYGPHLGSFFGASVLCADVDGDGIVDLIVGAPNYVKNNGLFHDQGAVFVFLTRKWGTTFTFQEAGSVTGSENSGARFGTTIAELGDVDGDGFTDIAIGAPWDNDGMGAVYIYKGSEIGLKSSYAQKIVVKDARTFGISISKGIDVDNNNCNDLAVGAYHTQAAYIFRCIPTMQILTTVEIPSAMDLSIKTSNFTAVFCVKAPANIKWPHISVDFEAQITVDPDRNRAAIYENTNFRTTVTAGANYCTSYLIHVMPTADMTHPILIKFKVEAKQLMKGDSKQFLKDAVRISDNSVLERNVYIQSTHDCGEDLICTPLLTMVLKPLNDPYIPGTDDRLGLSIEVMNNEEPAYDAKVNILLPSNPKKIPSDCILEELNITCKLPSPLHKGVPVTWDLEIEPTLKSIIDKEVKVFARLKDNVHKNNTYEELKIMITPVANVSIRGAALPNRTIIITRNMLTEAANISFVHYFEITNFGPSDLYSLSATIQLPDQVNITSPVKECHKHLEVTECSWSLSANASITVVLPLRFDLAMHKDYLEEHEMINITSIIVLLLDDRHQSLSTRTTLILDPEPPVWPLIVGLIVGFILLAAIIFALYKYKFFSRSSREQLKKLQEQPTDGEEPNTPASGVNSHDAGSSENLIDY